MMIRRLYVAVALAMITGPACAINWAGHDDWLAGHPAAQALEEQAAGPCNRLRRATHPQSAIRSNPWARFPKIPMNQSRRFVFRFQMANDAMSS
jgi:hypothetical protein